VSVHLESQDWLSGLKRAEVWQKYMDVVACLKVKVALSDSCASAIASFWDAIAD
jgi:hypothetical protein